MKLNKNSKEKTEGQENVTKVIILVRSVPHSTRCITHHFLL